MSSARQQKIVELELLFEVAFHAARVAGEISRKHFHDHILNVDSKLDGTPVTCADQEAEQAMREILLQGAPELGIFGEEYGHEGDSRDRWIIDPRGGPVKEERLDDRGQEFPRHDDRRAGKPYRYGYTAAFGGALQMAG